ncbi:MAG: NMD3-related protein [Nanoarchaeota archaeon]
MNYCVKCGDRISCGVFCEACKPGEFVHVPKQKQKHAAKQSKKEEKAPALKQAILSSEYFEGILQLRSENEHVVAAAFPAIQLLAGGQEKKTRIVKVVEHKKGVDLYFADKKYLKHVGLKLQKQFGGELSYNPQLFSHNTQTSRDIFRLNVLLQLPVFRRGDIVSYQGRIVRISRLGKTIQGTDLMTRSSVAVKKAGACEVLEQHTTMVSRVHPSLEVIHPETYQSVQPVNASAYAPALFSINQKVNVVVRKGIYLSEVS